MTDRRVALIVVAILTGCGGERGLEPTAVESVFPPSPPVRCLAVSFDRELARPGERVAVRFDPPEVSPALVQGRLASGQELSIISGRENGEVFLHAPMTDTPFIESEVEIEYSSPGVSCPPARMRIAALRRVDPSLVGRTLQSTRELARQSLEVGSFADGSAEAEVLAIAMNALEEIEKHVARADPDLLAAMIEESGLASALADANRALAAAPSRGSPAPPAMSARHHYSLLNRQRGQEQISMVRHADLSPSAQSRFRRLSTGGVGCAAETPDQFDLSSAMQTQAEMQRVSDALNEVGKGATVFGMLPGGVGFAAGALGAVNGVGKLIVDVLAKLLPSSFTHFRFVIDRQRFLEDEPDGEFGAWYDAVVRARSETLPVTKALFDIALSVAATIDGVPDPRPLKGWLDPRRVTQEVSNQVATLASTFCGDHGVCSVGSLGPCQYDVEIESLLLIEPTAEGTAIRLVDGFKRYVPSAVGHGAVRLDIRPEKFGGRTITASRPVEVAPISVFVRPDSAAVVPGEVVELAAEVRDAHDDGVEWSTDAPGVRLIVDDADPLRVRLTTPSDRARYPFAVIARSTANRGLRRNSTEERMDSAVISERDLRIAPSTACVNPGELLPMVAWYGEGEKADVSWRATSGSIDANGLFRAPSGGSGSVTIVARDRSNAQVEARAEVFLGCLSPLSMSGTLVANAGSPAAVGFMGWEPDDSEEPLVDGPFAEAAAAMRMIRGVAKQDSVEDVPADSLRTLQTSAETIMTGLVTGASIPVSTSARVVPTADRGVFHLDAAFDITVDLEEQRKKDFTIRESGMGLSYFEGNLRFAAAVTSPTTLRILVRGGSEVTPGFHAHASLQSSARWRWTDDAGDPLTRWISVGPLGSAKGEARVAWETALSIPAPPSRTHERVEIDVYVKSGLTNSSISGFMPQILPNRAADEFGISAATGEVIPASEIRKGTYSAQQGVALTVSVRRE